MPVNMGNRSYVQVAIAQGSAGSTDLVAAIVGLRIYVVTLVVTMTATGTLKFTEGTGPTDLTGPFSITAQGGFVVVGDDQNPVLATNTAGAKLSLTTTTGAAQGYLRYFTDS